MTTDIDDLVKRLDNLRDYVRCLDSGSGDAVLYDEAARAIEALQADADRRVAEEREACARVAADYDGFGVEPREMAQLGDASRTASDIASAIRSRSNDAQPLDIDAARPRDGSAIGCADEVQEWADKRAQLLGWTGSAVIAGEVAFTDETLGDLYSFLCSLIGYLHAGEDLERAQRKASAVSEPVTSPHPSPAPEGWQQERERLREALRDIGCRTYSNDRSCRLKAESVAEIFDIANEALAAAPPAPSQPSPVVTEDDLVPVLYGCDPLLDDEGEPIPFSWEFSEHTLDHFRKNARAVLSYMQGKAVEVSPPPTPAVGWQDGDVVELVNAAGLLSATMACDNPEEAAEVAEQLGIENQGSYVETWARLNAAIDRFGYPLRPPPVSSASVEPLPELGAARQSSLETGTGPAARTDDHADGVPAATVEIVNDPTVGRQ